MQGPDQVRREDEAALEDRDDEEIRIAGGGDLARHLGIARRDDRGIEEDGDLAPADTGHQRPPIGAPGRAARLTAIRSAPAGGSARAERKPIAAPAATRIVDGSTSQE